MSNLCPLRPIAPPAILNVDRGDIWWVNLDPTIGAEIKKRRPCVVLSANEINRIRSAPVVVPLSSSPE
jgi:mRNA interferase MazF